MYLSDEFALEPIDPVGQSILQQWFQRIKVWGLPASREDDFVGTDGGVLADEGAVDQRFVLEECIEGAQDVTLVVVPPQWVVLGSHRSLLLLLLLYRALFIRDSVSTKNQIFVVSKMEQFKCSLVSFKDEWAMISGPCGWAWVCGKKSQRPHFCKKEKEWDRERTFFHVTLSAVECAE